MVSGCVGGWRGGARELAVYPLCGRARDLMKADRSQGQPGRVLTCTPTTLRAGPNLTTGIEERETRIKEFALRIRAAANRIAGGKAVSTAPDDRRNSIDMGYCCDAVY